MSGTKRPVICEKYTVKHGTLQYGLGKKQKTENSGKGVDLFNGIAKCYGSTEKTQKLFDTLRRKPEFLGVGGWYGLHQ